MFNNQFYFDSFAKIRASLSTAIQEDFFDEKFQKFI